MNAKYLNTLEYNKIIEILEDYCKTYIGKKSLASLRPSFNSQIVQNLLNETNEAISLIIRKSSLPLAEIPDVSLFIKQLESYSTLSLKGLLDIASILKVSRELKEYFYSDENFEVSDFPILLEYFSNLYTNEKVEDKILSIILDENTISDNASSTLSTIRRKSKVLEQNVRDKLNSMIHSTSYSKYIMDPVVTIRNGRFVIPVKEEYKNNIKGFVHDISSSGSTVFIEPISIFDMNNEISNLKIEESIEIEKILQNLSGLLYEYTKYLKENLNIIGKIDSVFAKASYSLSIDGILPTVNFKNFIDLKKARHPLINKNTVVPIDLSVGTNYNSLVITGPNTGGKTVALKTTGLILLMAYSGLLIPCSENSSIYVFDNIFADIGDEQSIQESLSTFSSHMSNIIEITNNVTNNSLVLLDELGSGTDPIEGANLAISILQYFYNLGAIVISTTHYPEIKHYCLLTDGFENASCEFDVEKLKPTYKLLIGIPGKSNAFAISKKLGLNSKILENAHNLMEKDDISIEELMKNIYDDKIKIENDKLEIEKNLSQIEILRKSLEKENLDLKNRKEKLLEDAKNEAREILLSSKDEANSIIRELNELQKNFNPDNIKDANRLRNKLNNKLQQIDFESLENNKLNLEVLKALNSKDRMKNNTLSNKTSSSRVSFIKNNDYKSKMVSSEINVIGLNVDQAIPIIDKYLDDCSISGLSPIRIVHGKGTGKLRNGIHNFLKSNSHVKSFRIGTFGEGEMGVTVVELK